MDVFARLYWETLLRRLHLALQALKRIAKEKRNFFLNTKKQNQSKNAAHNEKPRGDSVASVDQRELFVVKEIIVWIVLTSFKNYC